MIFSSNIFFTYPFVLLAFLLLPFFWKFLKTTPPSPKLKKFPAIIFLAKSKSIDHKPESNSNLIVFLRLLLISSIILGFSQPQINKSNDNSISNLIILDNSKFSSIAWRSTINKITELILENDNEQNNFSIITSTEATKNNLFFLHEKKSGEILDSLSSLKPLPWVPNYSLLKNKIDKLKKKFDNVFWFTEPIDISDKKKLFNSLSENNIKIIYVNKEKIPPIIKFKYQRNDAFYFEIFHPLKLYNQGTVDCYSLDNKLLFKSSFKSDLTKKNEFYMSKVKLLVPSSLKNKIDYFRFNNINSSSTKIFLSETEKKKTVGIVGTNQNSEALNFDSGNYFVENALKTRFQIKKNNLEEILNKEIKLLFIDDQFINYDKSVNKLEEWVKEGGTLVKFGGDNFLQNIKDKSNQKLRNNFSLTGKKILVGGKLRLKQSLNLYKISEKSPLFGLKIPDEVKINKYIESSPSNFSKDINVWLRLENGTPLISSISKSKGQIIFFHIPCNTEWSNLTLSYFFVDILQKIIDESKGIKLKEDRALKPFKNLDAFGKLVDPSPQSLNIPNVNMLKKLRINYNYPPGLYKDVYGVYALNSGSNNFLKFKLFNFNEKTLFNQKHNEKNVNLKNPLFILAIILFITDTIITLFLRQLINFKKLKFILFLFCFFFIKDIKAEKIKMSEISENKIGYISNGNPEVDKVTYNGLKNLSDVITQKTAAIFTNPKLIDLENDRLFSFPLIYWATGTKVESLPKKIKQYINDGGLLLIDCKLDQDEIIIDKCLKRFETLLESNLPGKLKKLDKSHAIAKSFYLLKNFPGRRNEPVFFLKSNSLKFDNASSVVFGNNDWTGAWAKKNKKEFLYPILENNPNQRDISFRFGLNLLIYSLTGNYKTDQVHVPEILKRMDKK